MAIDALCEHFEEACDILQTTEDMIINHFDSQVMP